MASSDSPAREKIEVRDGAGGEDSLILKKGERAVMFRDSPGEIVIEHDDEEGDQ